MDVFRQISDAPVLTDNQHHYREIVHELEIAGRECRRVIQRHGQRVTRGATHWVDMEVATDAPIGSNVTQRWRGSDIATGLPLRVEASNQPDAYRQACRVWLAQAVNRGERFGIQIEATAPINEVDGFGCAGVKLLGLRSVDTLRLRLDFKDAPVSIRVFELASREVIFSDVVLSPCAPNEQFTAAYCADIRQPALRQMLIAWFRQVGVAVQPSLPTEEKAPMRILFLTANPGETSPLDLEEEIRSLQLELRSVRYAKAVEVYYALAARPDDLILHVRERKPTILHFSGHGSMSGIAMRADDGGYHSVTGESLRRFLKGRGIELVVLNSCYSKAQADAIGDAVGAIVGTTASVDDEAARRFTVAFYRALGSGLSIREAFRDGGDAVALYNLNDVFRSSGDLDRVFLN